MCAVYKNSEAHENEETIQWHYIALHKQNTFVKSKKNKLKYLKIKSTYKV